MTSPFLTDKELEECEAYPCKGGCEHYDCKLARHVAWRERGYYWDSSRRFFSGFESVITGIEEVKPPTGEKEGE